MDELQKNYDKLVETNLELVDTLLKISKFLVDNSSKFDNKELVYLGQLLSNIK